MKTTMVFQDGRVVRNGETVRISNYVTTFELATVFCLDPEMVKTTLQTKFEVTGISAPEDSVTTMRFTVRTLSRISEDSIRPLLENKCEIIALTALTQLVVVWD